MLLAYAGSWQRPDFKSTIILSCGLESGVWASREMRQCTIVCSLCHHGNRNGRAQANTRPRSHAQSGYDEKHTLRRADLCGVFHHSHTHTQPPPVAPCVTLSDRRTVVRQVVRDTATGINTMQTEWKEDGGNVTSMHTIITHLAHLLPL